MAVTTKKTFAATTNATTTVFSPVSIQLNNQDDLDVYVTLSGGTRVLQLRQSTGSTAQSSHPQVNNTDGLYFPAVSAGTTLYNYTLSSDNNTITFNSALPSGAVVFCERRTRDADSAYTSFASGSTIRATDLNNSSTESNFTAQDARNKALDLEGSIFGGLQPSINGVAQPFVNSSKIIDGSIATADIADSAITSAKLADGTIVTGDIADGSVTTAKIATDAVTSAKIADDQINSEHYVDGSIDTAHIADLQITTAKIATDAVTSAKIADGQVNSEHIANGGIDAIHLSVDSVETSKIENGAVTTAKIADANVTTAKIADANITSTKIASNAVTTDKIADSELSTLAGMQSTTASNLASSTALTATTAELNQLDGITLETSVTTNSDTRIPTSKAVNDLVLSVTNALGGFVAIANERSFPTSNPDPSNNAGTVVSISQITNKDASGNTENRTVNSSGVLTIPNAAGSNTVTITGFPDNLHSQTLSSDSGLQVQTTSTLHTYTFHKQLASAADIQAISATVNSFSNRYRVSASAPTSSLDGGDLWYDTTNSKLMVYSSQNSAWEESSAIGNFYISTISSSSSTGGGSATANGTAYRFTISNAPSDAQQCLVSVDGVIQKPNAGSSQPSEGFVLVGNDIIFGSAPANGASMFVTVIGSTVGIGTPSNNTVTTAILQNGSVTTAKIVDANVTTAKIADNAVTTAKIAANQITTNELAGDSVLTGNIANSAVSGAKIAANAVTTAKIADEAVTLAKLPHGTSSNNGKFLRANNGADPTFEVVNTDLVADTTPQLGGNLDCNGNGIALDDSNTVNFGNNGDLSIYHDGSSTNVIKNAVTGRNLNIMSANNNTIALFKDNNAVELYYAGGKKFETNNDGVAVTGDINLGNGTLFANDNGKIRLGGGQDLQLYHNGANGFLTNDTGVLNIQGGGGNIQLQAVDGESGLIVKPDAAVELYHNGSKKFETDSGGVVVTDNNASVHVKMVTSTGDSGYVYGSGNTEIGFLDREGHWLVKCVKDGKVELRYDNTARFETTANGIKVNNRTEIRNGAILDNTANGNNCGITFNGDGIRPCNGAGTEVNNTYDLGNSSYRWRNIYTNDLNLSNEGSSNDVDGTWGDWTIQEGESDLFLKNNRSGKKYKFNLTEVS